MSRSWNESPQSIWRRRPEWRALGCLPVAGHRSVVLATPVGTMPITLVWAGAAGYPKRQGKRVITSRYAQPPPRGVRTRLTRISRIWAIHLSGPHQNRPLDAVVMAARPTQILP